MIWRQIINACTHGKPVIASICDIAGSGGYLIGVGANKIVTQPGTVTGSIGVVGGKIVTTGFWKKLGVAWKEIHTGKNAAKWLLTEDFSKEEWTLVQRQLYTIYQDFIAKAAQGRRMDFVGREKLARGKIVVGRGIFFTFAYIIIKNVKTLNGTVAASWHTICAFYPGNRA